MMTVQSRREREVEEQMEQVAWILVLLLAFIVGPLVLWSRRVRRRRRTVPSSPDTPEQANPDTDSAVCEQVQTTRQETVPETSSRERSSGGARRMRRRPVSSVASAASSSSSSSTSSVVAVSEPELHDDREQDSDDVIEASYYKPKQSKKNERKHEKEAHKQAEIAAWDMREEKQDRQAELRRQRDEEREAEEQQKEEEAPAEFDKWKGAFSINTEGTQEQDVQEEGQGPLNDFVDYIKKHKCVAIEDLAAKFNLHTQDCINRVMALEQMGRISGVVDEQGKFIYISPEEMKAVPDYIKRLGRISIAHLASMSMSSWTSRLRH